MSNDVMYAAQNAKKCAVRIPGKFGSEGTYAIQ
jgi:hypothetical protein